MKIGRKKLLALVAIGAGLSLGAHAASAQQTATPLTQEQIKQIVASPDRSAADRTNDQRRKPEEMLVFIGIHPGITALDLSAAGGYTTVGLLSGSARDARVKAGIVLSGGSLGSPFSGAATPLLFVHGDADEVVPYATGRSAYSRSTWPKAFLTITGGNHSSPVFGSKPGTAASAVTGRSAARSRASVPRSSAEKESSNR